MQLAACGGEKRKRGRRHRNLELGANIGMNGGVFVACAWSCNLRCGGSFDEGFRINRKNQRTTPPLRQRLFPTEEKEERTPLWLCLARVVRCRNHKLHRDHRSDELTLPSFLREQREPSAAKMRQELHVHKR